MSKEVWKNIDGYDKYIVSNLGRVRNLDTGKILKHQHSERRGGYSFVNLYKDGKRKNINVHILVANHFIPKPVLIVDHKNRNRKDPSASNLQWITLKENTQRIIRKPKPLPSGGKD